MLLSIYWPQALGHAVIARSLVSSHYGVYCKANSTYYDISGTHVHQFFPWLFTRNDANCRSCNKQIGAFGLLCPFCFCSVHFDCYDYPEGNYDVNYNIDNSDERVRVAYLRLSVLRPGKQIGRKALSHPGGHRFGPVNLFHLVLCANCRQPLWGCIAQAMRCSMCSLVVHSTCASNSEMASCRRGTAANSAPSTIEWSDLLYTVHGKSPTRVYFFEVSYFF